MKNCVQIVLLLVVLNSCNLPYDDLGGFRRSTDTEFGDELILTMEDTLTYYRLDNGDSILAKGCYLKFHRNSSKVDTSFIWKETTVIKSHINKLWSDDTFILVDQKPLDSIFGNKIEVKMSSSFRPNMPEHHRTAEKQLKNSKIHLFWIIAKKTKDIYGPYKKEEYLRMRKELGVSNKLQLNE